MRWIGRRSSGNLEDRRGGGGRYALGGGVGIIVVIVALLLGKNPQELMNAIPGQEQEQTATSGTPNDEQGKFVDAVLVDTEDVWNELFSQMGSQYKEPNLVLFTQSTSSGCGFAGAATGPFYCPADEKVYIDLSFYDDLKTRFNAPGDFAMAYVIAHEVGHHVQNLMGITDKVDRMRGNISESEYNKMSVRLELQADFFAGVWAHHDQKMKNILEEGDIEEALQAANAVGDDRLQKQSSGTVTPDAFTHGTSEQRMRWFKKGFETGDIKQGDTFAASAL
ncbi:neutral zinc metallopeptidase [Arcticibacter tournemirensis]|uniref:Metalloprotease n=1 Tax=Arcticibacter tournemirensis TaxID=699437 RepID=A0A4Q0M3Q3_9SPHI|nr:neutral zinc metallopeptidase [Arcticibacter tournemirensis]RXF67309.1 metalloprotease [Arcticibacter tournemirensis]